MILNLKYFFTAVLLNLALLSHPTFAQDTLFRNIQLAHGISLDVPSHWSVLSLENRKNLEAAGQALADNAGIEGEDAVKEPLLAMNATPYPTGAMIRVSVTHFPSYTQSDLAAATSVDLEELRANTLKMFKQLESSGGPQIIEMQPMRIERINHYLVLVMPYVRAGVKGPYHWQVTQYKIPASNYLIEITLSYRQSDSIIWRPILERVKRSVKF